MLDISYPYKSNQDFIIELHQIASALCYTKEGYSLLRHYTTTPSFTCSIENFGKVASYKVNRQMNLIWETAEAEGKY